MSDIILFYSKGNSAETKSKTNKKSNSEFKSEYNKAIKEYTKLKCEYSKQKKLILIKLLNYLLILILLNPIFSKNTISLELSGKENNNYMPILNKEHIGEPKFIYLDNNIANENLILKEGNYIKFKCNNDICKIKLKWEENEDKSENVMENTQNFSPEILKFHDEMFKDCSTIISIDFSDYQTNDIISMSHMFDSCLSLQNITGLILNKVNDFSYSFYNCYSIKDITIAFNKESVENRNMKFSFANCFDLETIIFKSSKFKKF